MLSLHMHPETAAGYKSPSQIARRITESWATENLYCASCDSDRVAPTPCNREAVDFQCQKCDAAYQLKGGRTWNERRVPDAGYEAMVRALKSDRIPNLLVMQYTHDWVVQNLVLVPSFFFSLSAIEKRPPLGPTARRAGWIGCNILLSEIATEGKIRLVADGDATPIEVARANYTRVRPLSRLRASVRGWTLDVLRLVHRIGSADFDLAHVYRFEAELASLHPANRNIRPKIRQQLQVLRDLGFVRFLGNGRYRLIP